MGQDPYNGTGDFTPYQPDATPDAEPVDAGADVPVVPYGGTQVPYGAAPLTTPTASTGRRLLPWLIGVGVLVASCGGGVAAVVGSIVGDDSGSGSQSPSAAGEVLVNDLEAGQCLIGAGFATDEAVSALEVVPCSTAHDAQVLAVNPLDSKEAADYDYNDSDKLDAACRPFLTEAAKRFLQRPEYVMVAFTETEQPVKGDKVACLVRRADGAPLLGSWDDPTPEPPPTPSEEEPS